MISTTTDKHKQLHSQLKYFDMEPLISIDGTYLEDVLEVLQNDEPGFSFEGSFPDRKGGKRQYIYNTRLGFNSNYEYFQNNKHLTRHCPTKHSAYSWTLSKRHRKPSNTQKKVKLLKIKIGAKCARRQLTIQRAMELSVAELADHSSKGPFCQRIS